MHARVLKKATLFLFKHNLIKYFRFSRFNDILSDISLKRELLGSDFNQIDLDNNHIHPLGFLSVNAWSM